MRFDRRHKWGKGRKIWAFKPSKRLKKIVYKCRVCGKTAEQTDLDYLMEKTIPKFREMLVENIFKASIIYKQFIKPKDAA